MEHNPLSTDPLLPTNLRNLQLQWGRYIRWSDWCAAFYDRLLNSRFGHYLPWRGVIREIRLSDVSHNIFVRLGTSDLLVVAELLMRRAYRRIFEINLGEVNNVVDLGANIGISVYLWQVHFPRAIILAVEPDANNLSLCQKNASALGGVIFTRACAGGFNRVVALDRSRGEWGTRLLENVDSPDSRSKLTVGVPVLTMEELLINAGIAGDIDLMKCDIEGSERELFANSQNWLPRVRTLLIEIHESYTVPIFLDDIRRNGGEFETEILESGPGYAQLLLRRASVSKGVAR